MHRSGSKNRDGQTVRQGNAENVMPGSLDRADSNENKGERSNKFRNPGTKLVHGLIQSNWINSDKWRVTGDKNQKRELNLVSRHLSLVTTLSPRCLWGTVRAVA